MDGENREFLVENLLAATSPEYLESIEEARRDCKLRYVGLPLAEAFARKLKVSGSSTDAGKVKISKKKNNKVDKLCIV
ncbi:hypothetical protein M1O17_05795 [Dehalococcoidia bacterium]|nr:hypothetical protein [Dehalococcoidia bacterium]